MGTELELLNRGPGSDLSPALRELVEDAIKLAESKRAANTYRAYEADFKHFQEWCYSMSDDAKFFDPLPADPATVVLYLTAMMTGKTVEKRKDKTIENKAKSVATAERRLSGLRWVHEQQGFVSPTRHVSVTDQMDSIRRKYSVKQAKAEPVSTDMVRRMIATLDLESLAGLRDRALLLFGYASALRRSELVGLTTADLERAKQGYRIVLGTTKDDPTGKGQVVGVLEQPGSELCPVAAMEKWLVAAGVEKGFVFRKVTKDGNVVFTKAVKNDEGEVIDVVDAGLLPGSVSRVLKRMCKAADIPYGMISGHSLRAGHVTTAAENEASMRALMNQTRHKSAETTRGYDRSNAVFRDNSSAYLDLGTDQD